MNRAGPRAEGRGSRVEGFQKFNCRWPKSPRKTASPWPTTTYAKWARSEPFRNGQNWAELGRIGQNRAESGRTGQNWAELGRTVQNGSVSCRAVQGGSGRCAAAAGRAAVAAAGGARIRRVRRRTGPHQQRARPQRQRRQRRRPKPARNVAKASLAARFGGRVERFSRAQVSGASILQSFASGRGAWPAALRAFVCPPAGRAAICRLRPRRRAIMASGKASPVYRRAFRPIRQTSPVVAVTHVFRELRALGANGFSFRRRRFSFRSHEPDRDGLSVRPGAAGHRPGRRSEPSFALALGRTLEQAEGVSRQGCRRDPRRAGGPMDAVAMGRRAVGWPRPEGRRRHPCVLTSLVRGRLKECRPRARGRSEAFVLIFPPPTDHRPAASVASSDPPRGPSGRKRAGHVSKTGYNAGYC